MLASPPTSSQGAFDIGVPHQHPRAGLHAQIGANVLVPKSLLSKDHREMKIDPILEINEPNWLIYVRFFLNITLDRIRN